MTELAAAISRHYDQRAEQEPRQDDALRAAVAHDLTLDRQHRAAGDNHQEDTHV
ncbi:MULTISPECIES: hypothetical protein [Streptomyces]|uniref:hypothetical protein n=1 Tax=Streptomyces TaxID=1883 RepID=UPI00142D7913|nr:MULTISPECIES: hypothetical protein [Streptomyces]